MWKSFNSKIFALALIPFYTYMLISVFVFVHSGYQFEVFNPLAIIIILPGTILSAVCFSFTNPKLHMIGWILLLLIGVIGIYIGVTSKPFNWPELITSACLIAFAFALKDFVGNRLHD